MPTIHAPTKAAWSKTTLKAAWAGWPGTVARILLAALPLYFLFQLTSLSAVWRQAQSVHVLSLLLAFAINLCGILFGAIRWRLLLRAYGAAQAPSVLVLLRHYLISFYYSLLPTGLAGDLLRGYRARSCLTGLAESYMVLLVERLAGLFGLLAIALTALFFAPLSLMPSVFSAVKVGLAGGLGLAGLVLILPYWIRKEEKRQLLVARVPFLRTLCRHLPAPRVFSLVLLSIVLSFATQAVPILCIFFIAQDVAPSSITLLACARVVPFIILLTYIPLTPAGLGQREAFFVYFFSFIGIAPNQAVTISLFYFLLFLGTAGLGGLCYLIERIFSLQDKEERT